MSDVHGVKRVKTSEEVLLARRAKEAVKIEEFQTLMKQCLDNREAKVYTPAALAVTTQILHMNPDFYTVWNTRRLILLDTLQPIPEQQEQEQACVKSNRAVFMNELGLFMQLIRINPKSYWLWNHRRWCLETMPSPDWMGELALVDKMLTMDARNFHGWDYRRYVVCQLRAKAKHSSQEQHSSSDTQEKAIVKGEYDFTTRKINQSFSNYSAWHQRSKLLPEIVASMGAEEKNQVANSELELVKAAFYTDPDDQSAWLYYWWLVGKVIGFNDTVTLTATPTVTTKENQPIEGQWLSLGSSSETGSVWLFSYSSETGEPWQVILDPLYVLPSTNEKSVPSTPWKSPVHTMSSTLERKAHMMSYQDRFNAQDQVLKPRHTRQSLHLFSEDQVHWHTLDRTELLREEIEAVRGLLEIEPDRALQTLAHFLQQLVKLENITTDPEILEEEAVAIYNQLISLDVYRQERYKESH
ncbi:hypothetical protein BDF14DRAFT_1744877 [Spinellus fusiger]|nr:hypothetical protein BDF14DRAFT_1744877 [Spinellus fusiger]